MSTDDTAFGSTAIDWDEEPVPNMGQFASYEAAREGMEWDVPETFNIAAGVVTKHADDRGRVALFQDVEGGSDQTHTFWQLDRRSDELANALADRGVARGDRVAIVSARSDRVMLAHLAVWKLGAISVPLSVLYGPDGLSYRLGDCEPSAVVVDPPQFDTVEAAIGSLDSVDTVIGTEGEPSMPDLETVTLGDLRGPSSFDAVETAADDPAMVLYTSGTTGRPKGVVQAHQALIGWLPSFQMCFELPWHEADPVLYATPDLAWIGGINLVLGAWHYGFPAFRYDSQSGFDPATVFENIETWGLTRAVLVPAMLKAMRKLDASQYDLSTLTVVMSGSEPVSETLYDYVTETLGANLNEMYGQTEAMHLVTTCEQWFDVEPGSLGYPAPGHDIAVVDEDGGHVRQGEVGIIGLRKPDPAMFLELWDDPMGTERKFLGDGEWMNTDDLGYEDDDGQLWFKSRADNLILTSGYRVGPAEVEDAIIELDAVANVGVVGVDDDDLGERIKAYVEVAEGYEPSTGRADQIKQHVRDSLAKYQYPREVEFIDALPTTVTGKIQRHELEKLTEN
jgi:acetyl-CoA synthetase